MIVCFLHAKVGHRQAIYLDYFNVVKQTPSMKIVGVFAFMTLVLNRLKAYDVARRPALK